jgi:hypothetical protein
MSERKTACFRSLEGRRDVSEEMVVVSRQRGERPGRVKECQEKQKKGVVGRGGGCVE